MSSRVLLLLLGTLATVLLVLTRATGAPDWLKSDEALYGIAIANAAYVLISGVPPLVRTHNKRDAVDNFALAAVQAASELVPLMLHLPVEKLNISVFRFEWRVRVRLFPLRKELTRARHGQANKEPSVSSGIPWVKGRGVIGRAWKTKAPQAFVRREQWGEVAPTSRSWDPPDKWKFRWHQAALVWPYEVVIAAPIVINDNQVIGCVSIASFERLNELVNNRLAYPILKDMCEIIRTQATNE